MYNDCTIIETTVPDVNRIITAEELEDYEKWSAKVMDQQQPISVASTYRWEQYLCNHKEERNVYICPADFRTRNVFYAIDRQDRLLYTLHHIYLQV